MLLLPGFGPDLDSPCTENLPNGSKSNLILWLAAENNKRLHPSEGGVALQVSKGDLTRPPHFGLTSFEVGFEAHVLDPITWHGPAETFGPITNEPAWTSMGFV